MKKISRTLVFLLPLVLSSCGSNDTETGTGQDSGSESNIPCQHVDVNHDQKCDLCGEDVVTQHIFNQQVKDATYLKTAATCEDDAVYYYSCECGEKGTESFVDEGSALNHDYGPTQVTWNGDNATATRTCSHDETHKISETKKGTFILDTPADYNNNDKGHYEVTFDDTRFGSSQTEANGIEIPNTKRSHNYSSEWSKDGTNHWHACIDNGYTDLKKDEATHNFGDWEKVSDADYEHKEVQKHSCTICGYEETQEVGDVVAHSYSSDWSKDSTNHWHACTDNGYTDLKKDEAAHAWDSKEGLDPTLEAAGYSSYSECSVCGEIKDKVTLPQLNDTDYNKTFVTKLWSDDGKVYDTITYTLKDTTIGEFSFDVKSEEITKYIKAGSSYYSIDEWNNLYPDAVATVDDSDLTITLAEGKTTVVKASDGESDLDGTVDFSMYDTVNVKGGGTLDIAYSTLQDGVVAKSLIIDEGTTVNLTGLATDSKSGVKVSKSLTINGNLNVSNFNFGEFIDGGVTVDVNIGENGQYKISNIKEGGLGIWNTAKVTFNIDGLLEISNAAERGIRFRGSSEAPSTIGGNNGSLTLNISSKGTLNIHDVGTDAIFTTEKLVINDEGNAFFSNVGDNVIELVSLPTDGSQINVTGNGVFNGVATNYGITNEQTNTATDKLNDNRKTFDINISEDSTFYLETKNNKVINGFRNFIIANSDGSKCNAEVTLKMGGLKIDAVQSGFLNCEMTFKLNSSKKMLITCPNSPAANSAIFFKVTYSKTNDPYASTKVVYQIYTSLQAENFDNVIYGNLGIKGRWSSKSEYTKGSIILVNTNNAGNCNSNCSAGSYDPLDLIGTTGN